MRLTLLEHGQGRRSRAFIRLIETVARKPADPVVKLALVRPRFFGDPFLALVRDVMRGPSFWTPAEREYLAAFTSRLNDCPFCAQVHTHTTRVESHGLGDVDDVNSFRPEVAAVLPLLTKMTQTPNELGGADVAEVRASGVTDDAIVDALHVAFVFNVINRIANALGFAWESDAHARLGATAIHRLGYKLPRVLMR